MSASAYLSSPKRPCLWQTILRSPERRSFLLFFLGISAGLLLSNFFSHSPPQYFQPQPAPQKQPPPPPAPAATTINYSRLLFPRAESDALLHLLHQQSLLTRGRTAYLEFGSGGSTTELAPLANVAVSVEHDSAWCAAVRQRLADAAVTNVIQRCVPREAANATHAPVGWDGDYVEFRRYLEAVDAEGLPDKYDFVLVDGRARVAAALVVLPRLREESVVVVHDAVREYYGPLEEWYEVVEKNVSQSVGDRNGWMVLRRRRDVGRFPSGFEIQEFVEKTRKYF